MSSTHGRWRWRLSLAMAILPAAAAVHAQVTPGQWTDWGGGYLRGPDSASITVANSGAGTNKQAPVVPQTVVVKEVPMTDWGGGYLRGPDSASTTVANSGAGTPKKER